MNHTIHTRQDGRSGRRVVYCSCGWAAQYTFTAFELANQAGEAHVLANPETQAEFDARTASLREPRPEATEAADTAWWRRFETD